MTASQLTQLQHRCIEAIIFFPSPHNQQELMRDTRVPLSQKATYFKKMQDIA